MTHHVFRDVPEVRVGMSRQRGLGLLQSCCRNAAGSQAGHPFFRVWMGLFERGLEPMERYRLVLWHAMTTQMAVGQIRGCASKPGNCRPAVPIHGLPIALRSAKPVLEASAEVVLAVGVAGERASCIPAAGLVGAPRETTLSFPIQVSQVACRRPVSAFRGLDENRMRTHSQDGRIPRSGHHLARVGMSGTF